MRKSNLKINNRNLAPVIKGEFPSVEAKRQMAIKKVNGTLSALLLCALLVTGLNYYFATSNEMVLNNLNREIIITNDENFDLQYKLDKLKSFTNVGEKVEQNQSLKKAEDILEVPYVEVNAPKKVKPKKTDNFKWSLGY